MFALYGPFNQAGRHTSESSNGYPELESRALESVARAAPFAAPAPGLLEDAASVTFLETFLFRDDECFEIRSLAAAL